MGIELPTADVEAARATYQEQDQILQGDAVGDKPESNNETGHAQKEHPNKPILSGPPEREEEEDANHNRHDLGGANIECGSDLWDRRKKGHLVVVPPPDAPWLLQ